MRRCMELAERGAGYVAPNPMTGCVLVRDQMIIGEGFHRQFGGPHAEVNAIRGVADTSLLKEATLYVNLEPCSHHGKTPPCADLIIAMGIPKVVVGCMDENPVVHGKGIEKLLAHGVDVKTGVLEEECQHLNRRFFTYILKQRPYVILKWAQTADGFIDHDRDVNDGLRAIVSSPEAHELAHRWRASEAAVLVGTNTVLSDDPQLTVRLVEGPHPVRVTFDRRRRIPPKAKILDGTAPTIVFTEEMQAHSSRAEFIPIDFSTDPIHEAMLVLYEKKLLSVLVEGGAAILKRFLDNGIWDEARVFTSAKIFGSGVSAPAITMQAEKEELIGDDKLLTYFNKNS